MILVAIRVSECTDPVEGSITAKCVMCEEDCYVDPGSQRLLGEDFEVVCQHCVGIVAGQHVRDALARSLSEGT